MTMMPGEWEEEKYREENEREFKVNVEYDCWDLDGERITESETFTIMALDEFDAEDKIANNLHRMIDVMPINEPEIEIL